MPAYDYECLKCGHGFEHTKKVSEPHLKTCPKCGFDALIQIHKSAPSFELKGDGWYKNGKT